MFGGATVVHSAVKTGTPIITVKPNSAAPVEAEGAGVLEEVSVTVSDAAKGAQIVASQPRKATGRPELTEATIVVSGGRGTGGKFEPVAHSLSSVRLHAPIADPGKFICIGLNYKDHAAETNNPAPKQPPVFPKWANGIQDPGEPVLRPRGEKTLDWEVELGVVIGRTARFVKKAQALDYVYGYTIINDVSARDFQFHTTQWSAGKVGDTLAPVGPYIADRTEIPDPHVLDLKAWVNGQLMQDHTTSDMIFDVPALIESLSSTLTLRPGTILMTGTPHGVGMARTPPVWMKAGDTVSVEIEKIGKLENPVRAEA